MADAPRFDRALLREFALCFVEAAVTRLFEESETERNCMTNQEILDTRTNPGPELYTETAGPARVAAISDATARTGVSHVPVAAVREGRRGA